MHLGITNAKIVGFISTFLILVLSYLLLFYNTHKLDKQSDFVDHTNTLITNLEYLSSENKEIEYNFRGFVALRSPAYQQKFYMSVKHADSLYDLLRNASWEDPIQLSRLDTIRDALDHKVSIMTHALEFYATTRQPGLYTDSMYKVGYVGAKVGTMRRQIKLMQYFENALLAERVDKAESFSNTIKGITVVSLLIAFLLAISSFLTYRKENLARNLADGTSEQYRKELEKRVEELAIANKEIRELRNIEKFASTGRIARTIAHEVRNPLTNINLASEQLKESLIPTEENIMLIDMVKRNSHRINQLISNLLNATKFSELAFEKISINDLIDHALELAEDRISLKHIEIKKDYAKNICDINVDEDKLKIAFLNIIVNAIEAMEAESGILTIKTLAVEGKCRIEFIDNGIGMNDETISKLFEPFFTNKDNGNGLGLTNTQNVILNHKGRIEVESVEGEGSSFIITLDMDS